MECRAIEVKNFRNIEAARIEFDEGVNILVGDNAQGKTNLLEAICFAALGKSFRTVHEEEMIAFGAEMAEISLDFYNSVREQNITVRMMKGRRRRIEQNHVKVSRLSDIVGEFRTVLFCPEHLSLIKDGPGERRNFLDIAISQLYPIYLKSLQRYNKILKQRNQLIRDAEKNRSNFNDTVEFWTRQLSHEAAVLAKYRVEYLQRAEKYIAACFSEMTEEREVPQVEYRGSSHLESGEYLDTVAAEESYYRLLMQHHDREIAAGTTLWGIHKDDIEILLNGKPARAYASQGQQRSLALALKLAEGEVCAEITGDRPVFLFDDVFSELDSMRRAYLSGKIRDRQVIMTTCEPSGIVGGKIIRVRNGCYE